MEEHVTFCFLFGGTLIYENIYRPVSVDIGEHLDRDRWGGFVKTLDEQTHSLALHSFKY